MIRYALRRLLQIIPVFFIATLLIFLIVRVIPGDPQSAQFGNRRVPDNVRAEFVERYHLDEPLYLQYGRYVGDLLRLDLGESLSTRRPVRDIFADTVPRTATLAGLAVVFEGIIGIGLGLLTARRPGGWFDRLSFGVGLLFLAIPTFVAATFAQWLFGLKLHWFPVARIDEGLWSYVLPAMILAVVGIPIVQRLTRSGILETLSAPFMDTARMKGLPEGQVLRRHALRHSMTEVVTVLGLDLGVLLGGAVVVEHVFQIPGAGFEITKAIDAGDNTVVLGFAVALVLIYLVLNLLVDLLYAWIDPRIRYD